MCLPHDGLGFRCGVDDVAGHLRLRDSLAEEAERPRRIVAGLDLQAVKIDAPASQARAGARFQSAVAQAEHSQLLSKMGAGRFARPTSLQAPIADEDPPIEKGATGDHCGVAWQHGSIQQFHAAQIPGSLTPA
jgi:hypothetical protein